MSHLNGGAGPPGRRAAGILTALACVVGAAAAPGAHGALHDQIARASRAIAATPADPTLYLTRGELYRAHGDIDRALDDYTAALRLEPRLDAARLARGRLLTETGRPARALADLDGVLTRRPNHSAALVVRGRARQALGRLGPALADYDRALASANHPDWFLERARIARLLPEGGLDRARGGLHEALARLGPIPALVLEAVDLESAAGAFEAALTHLDGLLKTAPGHPLWLVRRGDLLASAGRHVEARSAFAAALAAIDRLPPSRRGTRQIAAARRDALARFRATGRAVVSVP
jgi:tetratricopeptide (TPR) repeat protein